MKIKESKWIEMVMHQTAAIESICQHEDDPELLLVRLEARIHQLQSAAKQLEGEYLGEKQEEAQRLSRLARGRRGR